MYTCSKVSYHTNKLFGSYATNVLNTCKYMSKKSDYRTFIVMKIEGYVLIRECINMKKFNMLLMNGLDVMLETC